MGLRDEWKGLIRAVAPALGAALGGPVGGVAVKFLADKWLGTPEANESDIASYAATATPEALAKLKELDNQFRLEMKRLDIDIFRLETTDVQDARKAHAGNASVFKLGMVVLISFAALMGAVLYGCWAILIDGLKVDAAIAAAVFGLIGTVVGYVAAAAQQVIQFNFGSSYGSKQKTDAMADAVHKLGGR